MKQTVRTVVFADLTGSTGLFESAGNMIATRLVTRCTQTIGRHLTLAGGQLVKYLGDGVLVLFDNTLAAVEAASRMQEVLREQVPGLPQGGMLGVKTGIERGPIVEHDGDCYGDAVNVAARLSDRAQPGETLIGEAAFDGLPEAQRLACQSLDRITIKGKAEPMRVWRVDWARTAESTVAASFDFNQLLEDRQPVQRIDIHRLEHQAVLYSGEGPLIVGRGDGAGFAIDDPRVSRRHARIEWTGGQCTFTDFSSNGSWVRFAGSSAPVMLRRDSCALYGAGEIGLGAQPEDFSAPTLTFQVTGED
ncbi:FHA domain-containing protein [Thauera sp.]|uniref:FHA domain-containing protein n=1 Tax=Thauera sp. TaxID=1905334 RepID=UPI0039E2FC07